MYTSVMMFALSGVVAPAADAVKLPWQTDYSAAQQMAARQQKPLLVVLNAGKKGWEKLSQTGKLSEEARQLLTSKYIPVYVDTTTPEGKYLATAFQMPSGQGVVISDRTGGVQAFWHEGELAEGTLVSSLERYADPERFVSVTETNGNQQTSYYQAPTAAPAGQAYTGSPYMGGLPGYYGGGFGGGGGCPTCGGGGGGGGRRR